VNLNNISVNILKQILSQKPAVFIKSFIFILYCV